MKKETMVIDLKKTPLDIACSKLGIMVFEYSNHTYWLMDEHLNEYEFSNGWDLMEWVEANYPVKFDNSRNEQRLIQLQKLTEAIKQEAHTAKLEKLKESIDQIMKDESDERFGFVHWQENQEERKLTELLNQAEGRIRFTKCNINLIERKVTVHYMLSPDKKSFCFSIDYDPDQEIIKKRLVSGLKNDISKTIADLKELSSSITDFDDLCQDPNNEIEIHGVKL